MARIKGKDIYRDTDDQIYFGPNQESALWWDGTELRLSSTISGVNPTAAGHLVTKYYLETYSTSSGVVDHGYLTGLSNDDHPQYVLRDGSRGFTGTVSGVDPTQGYHLTTRYYTLGIMDGTIAPPTASGEEPKSVIQFHYNTSLGESSTNSTSYVEKMRLTVSGIPEGNYRVAWAFSWRHSKTNTDFSCRIQLDDTEDLFYYVASPYVDVNYWSPVSSFYFYDALSSGTHHLDLDFASSNAASTSYMKDAKLEFWRVQ